MHTSLASIIINNTLAINFQITQLVKLILSYAILLSNPTSLLLVVPYWALRLSYGYWMRAPQKLDIIFIREKIHQANGHVLRYVTVCILIGFNDNVLERMGYKRTK